MGLERADIIQAIASRAGVDLHYAGRLWMVERQDYAAIVAECERSRTLILGVEGFRVDGEKVVAHTHLIADHSEVLQQPFDEACRLAAASARRFLASTKNEGN